MRFLFLLLSALAAVRTSALQIPRTASSDSSNSSLLVSDSGSLAGGCQNSPTSRQCWGEYNINTNYYDTIFHTGHTVEYWLSLEEIDCTPDGYKRKCITANGTMPGPPITANWGDNVIVHVTNNIASNGSAIHWHGVRQLNNTQYDGVPGVTQCPIAPGSSMTYKFHANQYGTSIYHSHFSLQYSMGLYGPLIINGPATADYDEDLGTVILTDWDHKTAFSLWDATGDYTYVTVSTGLVNGFNTGDCVATNVTIPDPNCINGGAKYQLVFEAGKKYRLRFINLAMEAWFQFSIDGHSLTVIQNDFVPIVPYKTDSVLINMGQRYDVIVEANAAPGDYWLRGGLVSACLPNAAPDNITGIVRYNKDSTKMPTSVSTVVPSNSCGDEPAASLVPWVPLNLTNMDGGIHVDDVAAEFLGPEKYLRWVMNNGSFMWTNWSNPALGNVVSGNLGNIPVSDNVFQVGVGASNSTIASTSTRHHKSETEWVILVIDDETSIPDSSHPMHLHGHDFLVLEASTDPWNGSTDGWQHTNPPRRDVATVPPNGHLVIAFPLDNPGLWTLHCHIAWHSSGGFGAAILESPALIPGSGATSDWQKDLVPVCEAWDKWAPNAPFAQDDSGI